MDKEQLRVRILLWKESLNSDGQQFHQYLQNEQSLLSLKIITTIYGVRNPGPGLTTGTQIW